MPAGPGWGLGFRLSHPGQTHPIMPSPHPKPLPFHPTATLSCPMCPSVQASINSPCPSTGPARLGQHSPVCSSSLLPSSHKYAIWPVQGSVKIALPNILDAVWGERQAKDWMNKSIGISLLGVLDWPTDCPTYFPLSKKRLAFFIQPSHTRQMEVRAAAWQQVQYVFTWPSFWVLWTYQLCTQKLSWVHLGTVQ